MLLYFPLNFICVSAIKFSKQYMGYCTIFIVLNFTNYYELVTKLEFAVIQIGLKLDND